ncbi:MAG TPA: pirin family protein [Burkholderiales bacterium]|nr:pirin family protein [Burkholderiales bacterium]
MLLVTNEDRIQPGRGSGAHGHQNREIIYYVFDGALEHKDCNG